MTTALGLERRNPANIVYNAHNKWVGEIRDDENRFCKFSTFYFGIRAIATIFINYGRKYHLNTIRGIINRHAPPHENATDKYVDFVCDRLKLGPDDQIDLLLNRQLLIDLIKAVAVMECGAGALEIIPAEDFETGVNLARKKLVGEGKIAHD